MNKPLWDNPNRVQGTILPDYPSVYDLGSEDLPFRDAYISGDIHISGDIFLDEVLLGNGSAADPSLSFQSDPDLGLYRESADVLAVASNGAQVGRFTTTGYQAIPGTVTTPGISFVGDGNTGIYREAADTIAFATNGTKMLNIDVSRTRIYSHLDIFETDPLINFYDGGPLRAYLQYTAAGGLRIDSDSVLVLAGNNSVGAEVRDSGLRVFAGTATTPGLTFTGDSDTGFFLSAANSIGIATNGTEQWRFNSDGHLIAVGTVEIRAASGTIGSPAYTFASDDDTGFYRIAADRLGVVTGAAIRAEFSSAGDFRLYGAGSAATPIFVIGNDIDTGMFQLGANTLSFGTGGVESIRINTAQIIDFRATMGNSTKDPSSVAPDDWVQVQIAGNTYYLPAYLAS